MMKGSLVLISAWRVLLCAAGSLAQACDVMNSALTTAGLQRTQP